MVFCLFNCTKSCMLCFAGYMRETIRFEHEPLIGLPSRFTRLCSVERNIKWLLFSLQALNSGFHHEHGGITPDDHVILWRCLLMACSIYFFYLFHIYFHSQEVKGKLDLQNRTIVVFQSITRAYISRVSWVWYNFMELLRSTKATSLNVLGPIYVT